MHLISSTLRSTPLPWLQVLSNIEPPAIWRKAALYLEYKLMEKIVNYDSWPIQPDILSPPSRKPLWLDLQPLVIKSRWRHNWKSAQVVNSHLVWPHNPASEFRPPSATVVSAEPFLHKTGTLRCPWIFHKFLKLLPWIFREIWHILKTRPWNRAFFPVN